MTRLVVEDGRIHLFGQSTGGAAAAFHLQGPWLADSAAADSVVRAVVRDDKTALLLSLHPRADVLLVRAASAADDSVPFALPAEWIFGPDGAKAAPVVDHVPLFPWPPPPPTQRFPLPDGLVVRPALPETLGQACDRILGALGRGKFTDYALYGIPDRVGFVAVTRLENIDEHGQPLPLPQRFSVQEPKPQAPRTLMEYVKALFHAPPGRYRIIALVVSTPFVCSKIDTLTDAGAIGWVELGLRRLPHQMRRQRLGPDHHAEALIYEFERPANKDQEAQRVLAGKVDGRTHVAAARLWRLEELEP